MDNREKIELFENMPILKAIIKLAIPTVISSLVMVIYNLADTYFVGMLNNPVQNAAVTFAAPVLLAFNAVTNLFGVGSSSLMSRALGSKNYKLVKNSSATGTYLALLCAGLISVFVTVFADPLMNGLGVSDVQTRMVTYQYLKWTVMFGAIPSILNVLFAYIVRAEGSALHASIGTMSGCLLNIILDPLFILPAGLNMGAAGAGLATCLSNCVACIYFLVLLKVKKNKTFVSIHPKDFTLQKNVIMNICIVGVPAAIQNLLNVAGMTISTNLISGYDTYAIAAMGITQKVNMIPVQIALGMGQSVMPLVSYNYSSHNIKRMKEAIFTVIKIALSFIAVVSVCYYCFSDVIISAFMEDSTIVLYGGTFLRNYCLGIPFLTTDFIVVNVFQATGMGKESLIFAIMRKIVLEIPAMIIWDKIWPMYGLSLSQFTAEFILSIIALFVLRRLLKKLDNETSIVR